jgi:hypothetical protein
MARRYVNIALASGLTGIFIESFLAMAFNNSFFIIHTRLACLPKASVGRGSGTYWRALEVGGMRGLAMGVAAGMDDDLPGFDH